MECNKDDALKAREVAERKFIERDYAGAKRFAVKAQNLFPALDGLSHMLTILDVYISAENKICGESDWYGILSVNPWDSDETIRKQYRKLALLLHPDKNKYLGADGAFKLVSEAWNLLSDKSKRLAYNNKRNSRVSHQKVLSPRSNPTAPSHANGFHRSNSGSSPSTRDNSTFGNKATTSSPYQKSNTFWTICTSCKTHYEYLRIYLNSTLLCPNCKKAFLAIERAPPPHVFRPSYSPSSQMSKNLQHHSQSSSHTFSRMGDGAFKVESSLKKRKIDDYFHDRSDMANQSVVGNQGSTPGNVHGSRNGYYQMQGAHTSFCTTRSLNERDMPFMETQKMLMEKARTVIQRKLEEWRSGTKEGKADKKGGREKLPEAKTAIEALDLKDGGSMNNDKEEDRPTFGSYAATDRSTEAYTPVSMNVPDSDFHNFDLDRSESSFEVDQVWAAYDDKDGMPRFYARIQKVMSVKPFKILISWLNSRSTLEFGLLDWIESGFTKTCGEFRTGRPETSTSLNSFSHKVVWSKGARGSIHIFPRKGEVWALYRNWSPNWNENTPEEMIFQYDMVEVLDDYSEEHGVIVTPLVKAVGFRTVFHKHVDPKVAKKIPREEIFRFSHQVPNYLLTGYEAENAPKGCRELDPAAIPVELLQLRTGTEDVSLKETGKKAPDTKVNNIMKDVA